MKISRFLENTLIDYSGKIASVIFSGNCNYRCPGCHAKQILNGQNYPEEKVLNYLINARGFVDGVVFCGGEPTMEKDISFLMEKIKNMGFSIKLDTNGSNPDVIKELLKKQLVDYAAMDIKGPKGLYPLITRAEKLDTFKLEESMRLLPFFPDYEFRTTVSPIMRDCGINFMTIEDIVQTAEWINSATGSSRHRYYLQPFVARDKNQMMDERLSTENLPKELHETPKSLLVSMKKAVQNILPRTEIR